MLTNGLPAPLNMSIVAGAETARDFYVFNEDGSAMDMRFYTFDGYVTTVEGEQIELAAGVSETAEHCVTLLLPALPMGTHRYCVNATSDSGERESFVEGVLGVQYPKLDKPPVEPVESPNRAVIIKLPGAGGIVRALWSPMNLTEEAVKSAIEAMKRAEAARDAVLDKLELALGFVESFDKALRESVRVIDNYLWIGGVNTGHYLRGDDGETPRYGSDGNWYIGDKVVGRARGDDGITPHITNDGYWAFGSEKTTVRAAGRDGLDGTAVRRILIDSVDELPAEEQRGVYYYVKLEEGYDVYVWLEPDGWVCVGEANDIATSEIYGLVKLGTDVQVSNGAPVGRDAEGQMAVPLAGSAVAGVGKLGNGSTISDGAGVGLNASGALMVGVATTTASGTLKLGTGNIIDDYGASVGLTSNKQAVIPWATESSGGAVRLGSYLREPNSRPYLVSIGATDRKQLAFNVLNGGALKHMQGQTGWVEGTAPGTNLGELSGESIYFGLDTSNQFTQSGGQLALEDATTSLSGGVYLAVSMSDSRANAVLTIPLVNLTFAKKADVYTKEEADDRYMTISGADSLYVKPDSTVFVRSGVGGPFILHKMSKSAFDALESRDANAIYLIKRG